MSSLLNLIVLFKNGTYHNNYKISYHFWINIYKSKLDLRLKKDRYFLNILKNNGYILGFNYQVNKVNKEELIDLKYLSRNRLKNKINNIENMFLRYQLKNVEIKQKVNNIANFKLVSNNFYKTIISQIDIRNSLNKYFKILFNIPSNILRRPFINKIEGSVIAKANKFNLYKTKHQIRFKKAKHIISKKDYKNWLKANKVYKHEKKSFKLDFRKRWFLRLLALRISKRKQKNILKSIIWKERLIASYFPVKLDKYLSNQINKWSYIKKIYKVKVNFNTQKNHLFNKDKKILQKYKLTILLKNLYSRNSIIDSIYFISKPGHKVYVRVNNLKKIIGHQLNYFNNNSKSKGNLGLVVLNTSLGLLSHTQAIKHNVGGELICIIK
jgi:ribosomal protein S8